MLMAGNRRVMGKFTISAPLKVVGWAATGAMLFTAIGVFATLR
jgi:hypothetical protein